MATPVVIVSTGGLAVTNQADVAKPATPMTVVTGNGIPVTIVVAGGLPVNLLDATGVPWVETT